MRVSELGICTAPLAFAQFASGMQVTLGQCCLFCVIMYYGVVIAVVFVVLGGEGGGDGHHLFIFWSFGDCAGNWVKFPSSRNDP